MDHTQNGSLNCTVAIQTEVYKETGFHKFILLKYVSTVFHNVGNGLTD
jgi:hypothetical protein